MVVRGSGLGWNTAAELGARYDWLVRGTIGAVFILFGSQKFPSDPDRNG